MGIIDNIALPDGANLTQLLACAKEQFERDRLDAAESLCREILAQDANNAGALQYLGLIAYKTGHAAAAAKILARAAAEDGDNSELLFYLANAHFAAGAPGLAADHYTRAIQIKPDFFAAIVNLSNTLLHQGDLAAAEDAAIRALEIAPDNAEALSNLGQVQLRAFRTSEAIDSLTRALERSRNKAQALTNLGAAIQAAGDVDGAMECFAKALQLDPDCHLAERNSLMAMLNQPDLTEAERFGAHRRYGARHHKPAARRLRFENTSPAPARKLKIGYVSSDFRDHPVGRNLLPLIANHDAKAFEIFLYAEEESNDAISARFRAHADHWIPAVGFGDAGLAQRMRQDGIDIAVFLAGRFNLNRPQVAAHRAAPVQVSYHDCATSGLDEMDYWLTDDLLHPEDTAEQFTERLYRLPSFYQFTLPDVGPGATPPPISKNGYVTFGCFNKPEKISDRVFAVWADILAQVPDARLALKYRNLYADQGLRDGWLRRFIAAGLAPERLQFLYGDDGLADHLGLYGGIDIALDPFPFNGATTTFEALAAGVPVIALWGDNFAGRVAATLLSQIGAADLASASVEDYIRTACALAGDEARMASLRKNLGGQLRRSDLCDGAAYAKNVEAALRDMWRQWCLVRG
ncbi:MAG: tetratricopeptide repeat protein [Rhodospirillaceae bacterium]|nr:tetratricopeptide repeat protein [Rhodospirillaceae bacterium]